jgi:hypothetical protein
MATIALPPPQPVIIIPAESLAQGREGRYMRQETEKILRHWNEPAELFLRQPSTTDELSYRSVLLAKEFAVQVTYHYRGELKPRHFRLDE